jgi:hypothetical protein
MTQATIGRLFACAAMVGMAHISSAEPLQVAAIQVVPALAQARAWGHVDVNPMVAVRAAMVGTDVTIAVVANTPMKDETIICADAVLGCGSASGPKRSILPWDLRRAGAGVAFTVLGTNVAIQRNGFSVVKSMTF